MTLSSVLQREPDWSHLPSAVSPSLAVFLHRCLDKDPKQRVGDVRDVRLAMEGAFETGVPQVAAAIAVAQPVWRQSLPVAATAAVVAALVTGLAAWSLWPSEEVPRITRLTIVQPDAQPLFSAGAFSTVALSPDGTRAVYVAVVEGQRALVVRALRSRSSGSSISSSSNGCTYSIIPPPEAILAPHRRAAPIPPG